MFGLIKILFIFTTLIVTVHIIRIYLLHKKGEIININVIMGTLGGYLIFSVAVLVFFLNRTFFEKQFQNATNVFDLNDFGLGFLLNPYYVLLLFVLLSFGYLLGSRRA